MAFIIVLLALVSMVAVAKRPSSGAFVALLVISLGPVIDSVYPQMFRNVWLALVFVILFFKGTKRGKDTKLFWTYIGLVFLKESLSVVAIGSIDSFVLSIYVYIVIFGIAYFSYTLSRDKDEFWNYYTIYIIICLSIQFYRAIFDFTFFGLITINDEAKYAALYEFGGEHFRPASLQGCIIYAIELAIYISVTILSKGLTRKNAPILAVAFIGLILTYSRSGLLIIGVSAIYYFLKKKRLVLMSIMIVLIIGLMSVFQYGERINEATNLSSDTYRSRFMSIAMTMNTIESLSFQDVLLGVGYGRANYVQENGVVEYYVEDYFISVIINSGIITFLAIILYCSKVIGVGRRRHIVDTIPFIGLILVNILASSMLAYAVQILFWILTFSILLPKERGIKIAYERAR